MRKIRAQRYIADGQDKSWAKSVLRAPGWRGMDAIRSDNGVGWYGPGTSGHLERGALVMGSRTECSS